MGLAQRIKVPGIEPRYDRPYRRWLPTAGKLENRFRPPNPCDPFRLESPHLQHSIVGVEPTDPQCFRHPEAVDR